MKILYYSPHPNLNLASPSGPGTHMREVIQGLEQQGHTVVRLIAGGEVLDDDLGKVPDVPWYKRFAKYIIPEVIWESVKDWRLQYFDKRIARSLEELVLIERPDFIYERSYYLMVSGVRVSQKHAIPLFIEMNAPYPEEKIYLEGSSFFIKKSQKCEHLQISHAKHVYVVSTALKEYFSARYPLDGHKIQVTPNAINPERAHVNVQLAELIRAKYHIRPDDFVIGFVGSIFKYHGVDRLLKAFSELAGMIKTKNLKLLIVGDGMVLGDLKKYASELNIAKDVIFFGNVPHRDVYTYISLMEVAVMARSNWYGSPVKVFEYGAMQKAIIAPDNVPLRDVMVNGEDGILVGEGSDEVRLALQALVTNEKLRQRMAQSFRRKVLEQYTWNKVTENISGTAVKMLQEAKLEQAFVEIFDKRVLVLRTDFLHHGVNSGYKQILRYIKPKFTLGYREGESDLHSVFKLKYQWLFERDIRVLEGKFDLVHVMYAEDYLRFSPKWFLRIPVVATFHQPAETLEIEITSGRTRGRLGQVTHWLSRSRFQLLAAAIVTEESQKKVLEKVMPASKIYVIPLGVHLSDFHEVYHQEEFVHAHVMPGDIITVGNWLRDWPFYMKTLAFCQKNRPDWKFQLVNRKMPDELHLLLKKFDNLTIHRDVSDLELKRMLFHSAVHFLPVTAASGNNALMEGLAMGCPAVMTNVVSEAFPLISDSVRLYPGSSLEGALKCLDSIMSLTESEYMKLKQDTFARSLPFDWREIALKTMQVYNNVMK